MTKNDVRTFSDLQRFAAMRAKGSLNRNDPWAMAYWKATGQFAIRMMEETSINWLSGATEWSRRARRQFALGNTVDGALYYSRAKWFVIMGRNNGIVMNPKKTGVNHHVFEEMPA